MREGKLKIFISYAHADLEYFNVFNSRLKDVTASINGNDWIVWDDTKIHVGTFWDDTIQNQIKECDVALLLVSVAFMASTYIRDKEFEVLYNKYKSNGVLIIPIHFAPCEFENWSDLSSIQFFKPLGSHYGKHDVPNFTFSDLIEFNRNNGLMIPNPNINRYILDLKRQIEISYNHFIQSGLSLTLKKNEEKNFRLQDFPKPSVLFTGRDKELKNFKKLLLNHNIFAIEGLGGTGKTQFAAKCISSYLEDKNKIIWFNGSSQSSFYVFIESAGYGDVFKGNKESELALFSGFKDLLERDEKIIFLDNYNEYSDPLFLKFISFIHVYLKKCSIVLITKVHPNIDNLIALPNIQLEGLNNDSLEFAQKLKTSTSNYNDISNADLEEICHSVEGHPLAIEFAMLLMSYGKKPKEIFDDLPKYTGIKKVEDFSKRLLFDILNHESTPTKERELILRCSVLKDRISKDELDFLNDDHDSFYSTIGLIDKLLLKYSEGYYEIHPLVRTFCYEKLDDKIEIHKKVAGYFINKATNAFDAVNQEKIFYHLAKANEWEQIANIIEVSGRSFIKQGRTGFLSELINKLFELNISYPIFNILAGDISEVKGEWIKAISYFNKASTEISYPEIKAEGIIKIGEIYFRKGDIQASLEYFEKAYKFSNENGLLKEVARSLNDIGLAQLEFDQLDLSRKSLIKALQIRNEINDLEGIADSYINLANLFLRHGRYNKTLEYAEQAKAMIEVIQNKTNLYLYYSLIADVFRRQKKFESALTNSRIALNISEETANKAGIGHCLQVMALILLDSGKEEESMDLNKKSLQVREEIGDERGMAQLYNNIGIFYFERTQYETGLSYLLKGLSKSINFSIIYLKNLCVRNILSCKNGIESDKFEHFLIKAYDSLNQDIKVNINIDQFLTQKLQPEFRNIGRNDICPCGSLKKFKYCHGKS